jgi:hypothetical protein
MKLSLGKKRVKMMWLRAAPCESFGLLIPTTSAQMLCFSRPRWACCIYLQWYAAAAKCQTLCLLLCLPSACPCSSLVASEASTRQELRATKATRATGATSLRVCAVDSRLPGLLRQLMLVLLGRCFAHVSATFSRLTAQPVPLAGWPRFCGGRGPWLHAQALCVVQIAAPCA